MNDTEFGSIKLLKLKYRMGEQIIQTFCKIDSPKKLPLPPLICRNFKSLRKVLPNHAECIENVMRDNEFGSIKLLKLKYRKDDQIIQTFCKIASLQKLGPHSLISRNFKTLRKVLLNHTECIKM